MSKPGSFFRRTGAIGVVAALGGCMNMSGLSGSSSYSCKAPEGVTCDSVSGTYANAVRNNLPSQRSRAAASPSPDGAASAAAPGPAGSPVAPAALSAAPALTMPLRSSARILRLWFKPWEDADRDLYDQGYVYVQIDSGQWLIEHARRQIREAYAPLRPPPRSATPAPATKEGSTALPSPGGAPRPPSADDAFPGRVPAWSPSVRSDDTE